MVYLTVFPGLLLFVLMFIVEEITHILSPSGLRVV